MFIVDYSSFNETNHAMGTLLRQNYNVNSLIVYKFATGWTTGTNGNVEFFL